MPNPGLSTISDIALREFPMVRATATPAELAAVRRLLTAASSDTGQSRRVANFLLAWWNAVSCGGFDLTDLWAVDASLAEDMLVVAGMIARVREYPDALGLRDAFARLLADWRPELGSD